MMDKVKITNGDSETGSSKTRTPAYATFDSNTDNILHLLTFIRRGTEHFVDELKNSIGPKVTTLCSELKSRGGEDTLNQREIKARINEILIGPGEEFTEGLLAVLQWLPVMLVTTVEAYLKDVRIFEAQVNPSVMESSEQSVTYGEVIQARSVRDLTEEIQARWARNFIDDGGPARWIVKLTKMGARGYESNTADKMEILWGVRHVMVHSAGIVTRDFVRRHPDYHAEEGTNIRIRLDQVSEWIKVVYHFVDITDLYFAQRYASHCNDSNR